MGGSLNPQTADPEFATHPRHEFNFWFDPGGCPYRLSRALAAHRSHHRRHLPEDKLRQGDAEPRLRAAKSPAAQYYLQKYTDEFYYLWDELAAAAWLDPKIITKENMLYVDVDTTRGPNYGDTLTWTRIDPAAA